MMTVGEVIEILMKVFAMLGEIFDELFGSNDESGDATDDTTEEIA